MYVNNICDKAWCNILLLLHCIVGESRVGLGFIQKKCVLFVLIQFDPHKIQHQAKIEVHVNQNT